MAYANRLLTSRYHIGPIHIISSICLAIGLGGTCVTVNGDSQTNKYESLIYFGDKTLFQERQSLVIFCAVFDFQNEDINWKLIVRTCDIIVCLSVAELNSDNELHTVICFWQSEKIASRPPQTKERRIDHFTWQFANWTTAKKIRPTKSDDDTIKSRRRCDERSLCAWCCRTTSVTVISSWACYLAARRFWAKLDAILLVQLAEGNLGRGGFVTREFLIILLSNIK